MVITSETGKGTQNPFRISKLCVYFIPFDKDIHVYTAFEKD
jgi:hypothetical protein